MDIDDGQLIELVQQFSILYDSTHRDYRNNVKKNNAWKSISEVLDKPAVDCEARWATLRTIFARESKKVKTTPSGSGVTKPWKWLDEMGFLSGHVKRRKTTGNVSKPVVEESQSSQQSSENPWDTMNSLLEDPETNILCEESETSTPSKSVDNETPGTSGTNTIRRNSSLNPPKKGKKKATQDDLVSTINSAWGKFDTVLREKQSENTKSPEALFGEMVGCELASITNRNVKYRTKQTILRALHEAHEDDGENTFFL